MPSCRAWYFDGHTAQSQPVILVWAPGADALKIVDPAGGDIAIWALSDVRQQKNFVQDGATLRRSDPQDLARLRVHGANWDALAPACPNRTKSDVPARKKRQVALWAATALASVAAMIFFIVPALAVTLAGLISPAREAGIGRMVEGQIEYILNGTSGGQWVCRNPEGQAAFDKMLVALAPQDTQGYTLSVQVVNVDEINAFALPGGQLTFFGGLLDRAQTQAQVAGVLAHEIGHVLERHPMEGVLRSAGSAGIISLLFGDATGGTVVAIVAQQFLNAGHSRSAEWESDRFALDAMDREGVDPSGLAGFFDLILEEYGGAAASDGWGASHPPTQDRAQAAQAAFDPNRTYTDILTPTEWQALKAICK